MESPETNLDPEEEFTSYLANFSSEQNDQHLKTFESWFYRDEHHYCYQLLQKIKEGK